MGLRIFKVELCRILSVKSYRIVLIILIAFSILSIVDEYRLFNRYDAIYLENSVKYSRSIENITKELNSDIPLSNEEIEYETRKLDFYMNNKSMKLAKNFAQGLFVSIFNVNILNIGILFYVGALMCEDYKKNMIDMQFACKFNRVAQFNIKLLAMIVAGIILFFVNFLVSFIFSYILMGKCNIYDPVTTMRIFNLAPIKRSIFDTVLISIGCGMFSIIISVMLSVMISVYSKNVFMTYLIGCLTILSSNIFYYGYKPFKYSILASFYGFKSVIYGNYNFNLELAILVILIELVVIYVMTSIRFINND